MSPEEFVDASPTKAFFIEMLTRDIDLVPAIIDLVDNCVDGARRLKGDGPYTGLSVRITAGEGGFRLWDNCGGIDLDTALKYAFRFGRPKDMERTPGSIGQFGVGMKRALFKLGDDITVESTSAETRFSLQVKVSDWERTPGWQFPISVTRPGKPFAKAERGTVIEVKGLHESVADDFALPTFLGRLREELARAHQYHVGKGLAITLNKTPIEVDVATLLASPEIRPAARDFTMNGAGNAEVNAQLYCGISESSPREAGWYVYCNGRLVLEADQTGATGWGAKDGQAVPSYHNQFAAFRGFVFLDSDDAGRLPWNTTKTGLDGDSDVYRRVRTEMTQMMRPVIDFLNRLDKEKDREEEEGPGPLTVAVKKAKALALAGITDTATFQWHEKERTKAGPKTGRIQYDRPVKRIQDVKDALGVATYKEVGEHTFDYYYELECE
jgi:Histidine kinase-, DNA gyrase B-, and HSP90-like ATPase